MPALAQETPAATPPAEPAAATVAVQGSDPVANTVSRDKDTLSVDFPDEDIKTILRNVADLFELNLVVPDTLTGKTSIKLRDVTWQQIFQVVLTPVGYTYIKEGSIIKVISNELLQQEPGTTEVFILNNAKASDIKPTIDGLIDAAAGGKIVIDNRSNALVITERPSRMGRIRTIIEQLDKATDQVMIESKFVEVTDRDIRNLGLDWTIAGGIGISGNYNKTGNRGYNKSKNNAFGGSSSSMPTNDSDTQFNSTNSTAWNTSNNTTTASSGSSTFPSWSSTATPPVQPPGLLTTTTSTGPASTNASSGSTSGSVSNSTVTTVNTTNPVSSALTNTADSLNSWFNDRTGGLQTAVFSGYEFSAILHALESNNNTKIVSNPTVVTLNNTEAMLNIGQEFPIPSYTYNSERGSFEVSGFAYKPIGIILKVTPQVNAQGIIKLALEPEVSQTNGNTTFGGAGGAEIPIIATRKVKTNISLKDGYTAGIGGLITNSLDHGDKRVPFLGKIPVLGRLFSSKSVNDTATNLVIFITAKTVNADGATPEEVFDPRALKAVGMTQDDLPGHRAPKGTNVYAPPAQTK
jgi:type IV pilus assembly protein PilQ